MLIFFDWLFSGRPFWDIHFFKALDGHNLPTVFYLGRLPWPEFTFVHDQIITSHHWNASRTMNPSHSRFCWTTRSCKILACISCHSVDALQNEFVMCHIYRQLSLYILHESWAEHHYHQQKWNVCWAGSNLHIRQNA